MKRGNTSRSQSRSRTVIRPPVCRTRIPKLSHPRPVYVVKHVPVKKAYSRARTAPSSHTISFNLPSSSNMRTPCKKRITNKKFKKKKPVRITPAKGRSRNVSRCTSTVGLSKSSSSHRYSEKNGSLAFFDIDTSCGKLFSSEGVQVDGPALETCKTTINFESDSPKTVGVVDVDKIRRTYGLTKAETTEKSTDPCFYNPRTEIFIEHQRAKTPKKEKSKTETSEKAKQKTVVCKDKKTKSEPKKVKEKPKETTQDEKGHSSQKKPLRKEKPKSTESASETLKRIWNSLSSGSGTLASTSTKGREPISKYNPQSWTKEQQITAAALTIFAILVAGVYYFETRE